MISLLTETLQKASGPNAAIERGNSAISGKRELMTLLLEKTLEYLKCCDPSCEVAVREIATLYETLLDAALELAKTASKTSQSNLPSKTGSLLSQP